MPKPRVLATRPLFPAAQQILNASCEVEYWTQPERISKEELFRRIADKEGLVCLLTERVNEELLRAAPKLRIAANGAARSGNSKAWDLDQLVGTDVWGKALGLVGFGRIGRAVARRAAGFQMKVIYSDAQRAPAEVERALKAEFWEMNALLAESDFISVHVPLLPETRR